MQESILEAKNELSWLIEAAQAGEEVVIANRGQPVAKLVPVQGAVTGVERGTARVILAWLDAHPLPAYARRSAKGIDADIRDARESWD